MPSPAELEAARVRAEKRAAWDPGRVERVRRICLGYPEVREVEREGEPWYFAGETPFASYGAPGPRDGMAFNLGLAERRPLLDDERFQACPEPARSTWTVLLFGRDVDWAEVEGLVDHAYRLVASKRMLGKLDASADAAAQALAALGNE